MPGRFNPKTVVTDVGDVEWRMPRDHNGTFEPVTIPKHTRRLDGLAGNVAAESPAVRPASRYRSTPRGVAHRRGGYRDPESQAFIESWSGQFKKRCA